MSLLIQALAAIVVEHVREEVARLTHETGEYRAVFNGPPVHFMKPLFSALVSEGGINAELSSGRRVVVPVLLQLPAAATPGANPPIGQSGICDGNHLLDLRNSTTCPRYVALVCPGTVSNLSQTSTRSDFGLRPHNNSGSATIAEWWNDPFIENLVDQALRRRNLNEEQFRSARRMVHAAVEAANDVDANDTDRLGAWCVLTRLWEACDHESGFGKWLALACGYPPSDDGRIDYADQSDVLDQIAARIEEFSIAGAISEFKQKAESDLEREALDEFGEHLRSRAETLTVLTRALANHYAPNYEDQLATPPRWWVALTTECWRRLLEAERRSSAVELQCLNPMFPATRGLPAIVKDDVSLLVRCSESIKGKELTVLPREVS